MKTAFSHRQTQAKVVCEALEAAALVCVDPMVCRSLQVVARAANVDTLAFIARLLK